ncbi:MAG: outer membrane beta-barrel protein [Myxococcota bacterium]
MKVLAISATLLVAALSAQTARAGDDDPYNRPGGYMGVAASIGVGLFAGSVKDAFGSSDSSVGDSWGANARAGYRFNRFLAAEVEYEWMRDFSMNVENAPTVPNSSGSVNIGKVQEQTVTANLKVIAPYGAFQPYFLAGMGAIFPTVNKSDNINYNITNGAFAGRFGAGIDYWVTQNLSLNLGAEVVVSSAKVSVPGVSGSGRGIDYLSGQFGFGYRF